MLATILPIEHFTFCNRSIHHNLAIVAYVQQPAQTKPIEIQTGKVVISPKLQQVLAERIPTIEQKQLQNFRALSIPIDRTIGLGYRHQGYNSWKIELTYGAYSIATDDETIYTITEIFKLKQAFDSTPNMAILGRNYATSGSMQQVGPMLHQLSARC
jgi:hypothetical protein